MTPSFQTGTLASTFGPVPVVSTDLTASDVVGAWKVRWAFARMTYAVSPGLYAVGEPNTDSPVLVSANYKFSFDMLRRELSGINAWILVLDTKGVNVWCAAGKGTFGTEELVTKIQAVNLAWLVNHRRVICPQLGAPGIAAHLVKQATGFSVTYGPVYASDLPAFLEHDMKATAEMRRVRFGFLDRLVVVPVDIMIGLRTWIVLLFAMFALAGIGKDGYSIARVLADAPTVFAGLLGGFLAGTVATPLLLPWLPGRSFSMKGLWSAFAAWGIVHHFLLTQIHWLQQAGWLLMMIAVSTYTAMNFTGASTYTSLSGVTKEMKTFLPWQLVAATTGLGCWILGRILT